MRSIAVRPSSFSRLYCWAGVSSLSNTTVSASTARHSSLQLLGLALADEPRVIGVVAALHQAADLVGAGGVDQQRPARRGWRRCPSSVPPGKVTPTSTIRSRMVRSISVAPSASLYGCWSWLTSMIALARASSIGADERGRADEGDAPADRSPCERDLGISAVHVHDDFPSLGGRRGPSDAAAQALAHAPVPHASVMPAPRSWTRIVMASRLGPGLDDLEVDVGHRGAEGEQVDGRDVVDGDDGVRVADAEVGDRAGRGSVPTRCPAVGLGEIGDRAHVDAAPRSSAGRRSADSSTRRAPASVRMRCGAEVAAARGRAPGRSSGCRCRSSRPGCRRRCTAPCGPRSRRRRTRRPAGRRRRCRVRRSHSRRASAGRSSTAAGGTRRGSRCRGRGAW